MKSFLSFIMSAFTFLGSFFGIASGDPVQPAPTEDFVPAVRFMVCSDIHTTSDGGNAERNTRIKDAFDFCYDYAQSSPDYKTLDAALLVGDITNNGTDEQFEVIKGRLDEAVRPETQILAVVPKNHDGYRGMDILDKVRELSGYDGDFNVVINGFHFIGLSRSKNKIEQYGIYQRKWLREQLDAATAEDPSKPVFVCHHEHIFNTVYGSSLIEGWGISYFTDILNKYPQVVHFSGHSHYPLNDPRSVKQGKFTTVGTGSMSYMEFTYKLDRSIHPVGNTLGAQAWIVEADASGRIRLTGFDVVNKELLCCYVINDLKDKDNFVFTDSNMKALSSAPEFSSDAEITITENDDGTYTASVPEANSTDGKIIFLYRIRVFNKLGIRTYSQYMINNYYYNDTYDTIEFKFEADRGSRVEITAENAYYMESEPVTAVVQ